MGWWATTSPTISSLIATSARRDVLTIALIWTRTGRAPSTNYTEGDVCKRMLSGRAQWLAPLHAAMRRIKGFFVRVQSSCVYELDFTRLQQPVAATHPSTDIWAPSPIIGTGCRYRHARLAGLAARRQRASPTPTNQITVRPQQESSLATGETIKNTQGMPRQGADTPQVCPPLSCNRLTPLHIAGPLLAALPLSVARNLLTFPLGTCCRASRTTALEAIFHISPKAPHPPHSMRHKPHAPGLCRYLTTTSNRPANPKATSTCSAGARSRCPCPSCCFPIKHQ